MSLTWGKLGTHEEHKRENRPRKRYIKLTNIGAAALGLLMGSAAWYGLIQLYLNRLNVYSWIESRLWVQCFLAACIVALIGFLWVMCLDEEIPLTPQTREPEPERD